MTKQICLNTTLKSKTYKQVICNDDLHKKRIYSSTNRQVQLFVKVQKENSNEWGT